MEPQIKTHVQVFDRKREFFNLLNVFSVSSIKQEYDLKLAKLQRSIFIVRRKI